MQEKPGYIRLAVSTTFAEAAGRARRLAEQSGLDILVSRSESGFGIWGPSSAHAALEAHLREIDGGVVEPNLGEESEAAPEFDDAPEFEEMEFEEFSAYHDEVREEIAEDIADEMENWAASEEEGWYYRD